MAACCADVTLTAVWAWALCSAGASKIASSPSARAIEAAFLAAYRWQYIHSGARHPYFGKVLNGLITKTQGQRIQAALATLH